MIRPNLLTLIAISILLPALSAFGQYPPAATYPPQPVPQAIPYPAVPGALPPGLYRAGAMPQPPPGFYDLNYYYNSGYAVNGSLGYGYSGYGFDRFNGNSARQQYDLARVPYQAAIRDAQDYHYLNQIYRRDESLLARNASLTSEGSAQLRAGYYERAAVTLLAAAEANHDDALSRVRAGHALFVLGRYDEAVRHIRRAFELQPELATIQYDMRDDFGRKGDFDRQFVALERFVSGHPGNAAGATMLAYVRYYTSGAGSAYPMLRAAKRLDSQNELVDKLLAVAGQVYSPNTQFVTPQPVSPTVQPKGTRTGGELHQVRLASRGG